MSHRRVPSLLWPTLALVVPLLVLATVAWWGTRSQLLAAWESARDEAKVSAGIAGEALARDLELAVVTVKIYPDPPVPGELSAADEVLGGDDLTALRTLRDDENAGVSPAGLPRRVLAGLRIYQQTGEKEDGEILLGIAVRDAPSVITSRVFGKLGEFADESREIWKPDERARAVFRKHGEVDGAGKWISADDGIWWLAMEDDGLRVVSPQAMAGALADSSRVMPAWAGLRFAGVEAAGGRRPPQPAPGSAIPPGAQPMDRERSVVGEAAPSSNGVTFTSHGPAASARQLHLRGAEVLATAPVKFGAGGMLEIVAARPEMFESAARQQARWTLGLLALAVGISGGALWMIHRAVARERRLNALKSDFVASVSHELRAPVASIRLMADALGAGKLAPRAVAEFHGLISREGARLSALIENVLDFARIEQGRKRWDFESAELAPLLRESLELMAPLAAEKEIQLVADDPLPELVAEVDPGAIRQALVNLLDNAIKFSPPKTEVRITLAERDGAWRLAISDRGPGIPAGERERVFERFHRLGGELRRETQGTGIGLSLVKAVAEAHGGRVELECEPGGGSVFTIIGPMGPISPITP